MMSRSSYCLRQEGIASKMQSPAFPLLKSNEPDLSVNRIVRVQAQQDLPIHVSSPAIYVRCRKAETYTEASRL